MVMQNLILAAQNDVDATDLGVTTATVNFTRALGGSVGTAVFGAIMAGGPATRLRGAIPSGLDVDAASLQGSPETILGLAPPVRAVVVDAFSGANSTVFLVAVPLALLAFLLMVVLPEHPLRETRHVGAARDHVPTTGLEPAADPIDTTRRRTTTARTPTSKSPAERWMVDAHLDHK
jgi:hypothetical protein